MNLLRLLRFPQESLYFLNIHNIAPLRVSSSRIGFHQAPDNLHIPQVFDIILSRGLHDAGQANKKGMVDDVPKPFEAYIPLSNMPVSVHMTSKRRPGIVEVDQMKFFQPDLFPKFLQGFLEPLER